MKKYFNYSVLMIFTVFGLFFAFPSLSANADDVKQVYKETCDLCHGMDGKGTEAGKAFGVPDFTDPNYQRSRTDKDLRESMTNGTKNPNYVKLEDLGVDLSHLDALIAIVRSFGQ